MIGATSGSEIIGWRIWPSTPLNVAVGYGNGGGEATIGKPGSGFPVTTGSGVFFFFFVVATVPTYGSLTPPTKTLVAAILEEGAKPFCPASATSSSGSEPLKLM